MQIQCHKDNLILGMLIPPLPNFFYEKDNYRLQHIVTSGVSCFSSLLFKTLYPVDFHNRHS
jgi:hypothetical protein